MPTHLALLRGINVGGRNRMAMAELREVVASMGHRDVATYIQSGNVVFTTEAADTTELARALEDRVTGRFGLAGGVVVLSRADLAQAVRDNPYPDERDPKAVHAVWHPSELGPQAIAAVAAAVQRAGERGSRDAASVSGRVVFLHTPDGLGRSELAAQLARPAVARALGGPGTGRNWATVIRLLALLDT